jgi:WD40 repeat protein
VKKVFIFILSLIVLLGAITIYILYQHKNNSGEIATLSISSDGQYVVSVDVKNFAILWDVKNKKKLILSRDANLYSAYWIKNTTYFMWQNNDKAIYVLNAKTLKEENVFHPTFLVFGQDIDSNLNYHVMSDQDWNLIYAGKDRYLKLLVPHFNDIPGFDGANKLVNMTFLNDHEILLSGFTGYDPNDVKDSVGVQLWDLTTGKKVREYFGNQTQTFATISPDGQYIVAGDSNNFLRVWETQSGKNIVNVIGDEPILKYNPDGSVIGDENVLAHPSDFVDDSTSETSFAVLAVKFIDSTHYLRFTTYIPYAMLYEVTNSKPLKYIPLGRHPYPAVDYYARDQAIDTAPDAHILVMAKENEGGILVYQYDPEKQTLIKIWNGK